MGVFKETRKFLLDHFGYLPDFSFYEPEEFLILKLSGDYQNDLKKMELVFKIHDDFRKGNIPGVEKFLIKYV